MKARYLKQNVLTSLRESVAENLDVYRSGSFKHLSGDPSNYFEGSFDFDESALKTLQAPTTASDFEAENCLTCYEALSSLSPYEAREERFWAYVTHTCLLDYTRARWPIPADDAAAVTYILTHFFAANKRAIERDNSASRLWWMAHLCHRINSLPMADSLQVLHYRTDVRANIIERPTISQNTQIFGSLIKTLKISYDKDRALFEREVFRQTMIKLNSVGGARLLDSMSEDQITTLLSQIVTAGSTKTATSSVVGKAIGASASAKAPAKRAGGANVVAGLEPLSKSNVSRPKSATSKPTPKAKPKAVAKPKKKLKAKRAR